MKMHGPQRMQTRYLFAIAKCSKL